MAWRLAESLAKLRDQVDDAFPRRKKGSDGTIGDAAHASRNSDHNPWVKDGKTGVVTGIDITHDPKGGVDAGKLAEALRSSRDERIKYIISNARICSGSAGPAPWAWRRYTGANAHRHHVHLSVKPDKHFYDSRANWDAVDALANGPIGFISQPDDPGADDGDDSKPGFFSKARNWLATMTGFGGLTYFTDWQIALVVFGGLLVLLVLGLVLCLWLFGKDGVRRWIRKQVW